MRVVFSGILLIALMGLVELGARQLYRDAFAPHPRVVRNRLGYRDGQIKAKRPDVYRIIVVGDSFTFGDGIEERDRFSNLIEDDLGPRYEVLNFGTPAHNLPQHLRTLDRALPLRPDFVLLQLYENDFETRGMVRPMARTLPDQGDSRWLRSIVLYRLFNTALVRFQQTLGLSEEYSHYMARHLKDPNSPDAREAFGMLRTFIEKCRAAGVPVGTVLFPALWVLRPGGRDYPFDYLHAHVRSMCSEEKIPCVDLFDNFAQHDNPQRLWVNAFDPHPNAEANHRAAAEILHAFRGVWIR